MQLSRQRQGELFILSESLLWSLFPIITFLSFNTVTPIVSLAVSSFFSIFAFAAIIAKRKLWYEIKNRAAFKEILIMTVILGIGYYLLFFIGLQYTSPGNASIVGLTQVFFSFLFFHVLKREKIPFVHVVGGLLMVVGAFIILGSGFKTFNFGDMFILIGSIIAPFGNYYAQKARKKVSSETMMFVRSVISTIFIFLLLLFLKTPISLEAIEKSWLVLLINGILLLGLSKLLWIEGIHRISVPKANAQSSIEPLLTLLFAWAILQHVPTTWQLLSLIPISLGAILLSKQSSNPPSAHQEA